MSLLIFSDNASSLLASGINNSVTTLAVTAATGGLFPSPGAGQKFIVTVEDTSGNIETMDCTGRTGDTLTVVRGQYGTSALAFSSGSRVEVRANAGSFAAMLQKGGGDTLAGTTTLSGVIDAGSSGSFQGGEAAGTKLRSAAGVTTGEIYVSAGVPKSGTDTILTAANIAANMPSGYGLWVTGMIGLWYGSSGSVPAGFHICDGASGTPDMRDKFVVGAGTSYATGDTGGSSTTGAGGGHTPTIQGHALTETEMPAHIHFIAADAVYSGSGSQDLSAVNQAYRDTNGGPGGDTQYTLRGTATAATVGKSSSAGSSAAHTHVADAVADHTHTCMPPYIALFWIMKL